MISEGFKQQDIDDWEELDSWLQQSLPEGVPTPKLIESSAADLATKNYLETPAKHRKLLEIPTPILRFHEDQDSIWNPTISPKPFILDFLDGALGYRIARAESDSSPLRKALPRARDTTNKVLWDLCGGWRVDALLMAHWNFEVHSFEKSPWVHLFSSRALNHSKLLVEKELSLKSYCKDANEILESTPLTQTELPSIIYIDPMYPNLAASALNQMEMRILHDLSSTADIAEELLQKSLPLALDRVVIKRPAKAPDLQRPPNHRIEQGSTRYDIYLSQE